MSYSIDIIEDPGPVPVKITSRGLNTPIRKNIQEILSDGSCTKGMAFTLTGSGIDHLTTISLSSIMTGITTTSDTLCRLKFSVRKISNGFKVWIR